MRSSSVTALGVAALLVTLLACTREPATAHAPAAPGVTGAPDAPSARDQQRAGVSCIAKAGAPDADAVMQLRKSIESGPLFLALATRGTWLACSLREVSGKIVLDYEFSDKGQLHVERDERIEFTLDEARFGSPQSIDWREVLTRAERAMFGADGCGIDWARGDTQPMSGDETVRETTYRGDTCNCQARVRTDSSARVVGLLLRSAC